MWQKICDQSMWLVGAGGRVPSNRVPVILVWSVHVSSGGGQTISGWDYTCEFWDLRFCQDGDHLPSVVSGGKPGSSPWHTKRRTFSHRCLTLCQAGGMDFQIRPSAGAHFLEEGKILDPKMAPGLPGMMNFRPRYRGKISKNGDLMSSVDFGGKLHL